MTDEISDEEKALFQILDGRKVTQEEKANLGEGLKQQQKCYLV